MEKIAEKTTAAACSQSECEGCEIEGKLLCVHKPKDLIDFYVLFIGWAIPFFAGMIIGKFWMGITVWVVLAIIFFGYIEALILCRHCPHYAEDGFLLRCHANWGLPKIPKLKPQPMNSFEKVAWLLYVAVLFLYYVPFFVISGQWLLLILTSSALVVAGWTLQRTQCNRCYNLACPINRVPDDVREAFFRNYPEFGKAWGKIDLDHTWLKQGTIMFNELKEINSRPEPFQFYTANELWTDEHTSQKMLEYHLNASVDLSSRNKDFIDRSVKWIVSHFGIDRQAAVADFGCGPGLYTTLFAERKADVTGIDFSERSIHYAKDTAARKALDIDYVCRDYLEFETEKRYDLITMIMCDFCALSPIQRKKMLTRFHSLLKADGAVLLDVYSLNAFDQRDEASTYEHLQLDGFWSKEDYYGFLNTFKYDEEKVILDKYTIIEKARRRIVYNWLQYFSPDALGEEFDENGFKIEDIYSDVAGKAFDSKSTEFAVVALKL